MAISGVYFHIPFCRKACHYCNFHFSTSLAAKDKLVKALTNEIELRSYKQSQPLESIYFGGGTPSLLAPSEVESILLALSNFYSWSGHAEITLEANPEDITADYLRDIYSLGINRLSIGIQSFLQKDLVHMNRAHDASQSHRALELINSSIFDNYTMDLMFGLVGSDLSDWEENLQTAISFQPPHISCYNLTIEEQTAYGSWHKKGKLITPDEDLQEVQFLKADEVLSVAGYEHYEISNYAKLEKRAIHNSNYWNGRDYLGIGPAAHSLIGGRRSWSISNNAIYIRSLEKVELPMESEVLSEEDRYNEIVMLGLRKKDGVSQDVLATLPRYLQIHWEKNIEGLVEKGILKKSDNYWSLSPEHWYLSDHFASELFYA